ncbi:hypothetical protein ACUT8K_002544 [Vibrio parahaemolyticus]|uniref:Uncharacterized protein n=1 Tax=Vibrio parahaemolyticus TaxID=670 RepID=A0A9P2VF34_VIBPH|nr:MULTISPECIES: hypothetical protein [Vibrio]KIT38652.1 hypothetical protein H331_10085 [Vibrio parahaemolyticus 3644]KIT57134.1 hypothetical protein H336_19915 [Vibrio parahaemolyticus EN9701072]PWF66830.1 hypothetical protein CCD93_17580 [Vibrio sp. T21]EGQ7796963.1 hypothetical protein [Vibrio parahaemolyticus]EGQ8098308.1 hypothetical protein [Vibrio parahaemolyticus]
METVANSVYDTFIKTAEVYYYGDHLTGDLMLGQCLNLLAKLFSVSAERTALLEVLSRINLAREAHDFTTLADILMYEIAPKMKS